LALHGLDDCEEPPSGAFFGTRRPRPKLRRRRSRGEMMLNILEAVKEGAEGPTQIMYRANLSWSICQELLGHLVERSLIKRIDEGERRHYELTPKGSEVLGWSSKVADEIGG